jgi:hypothetical protein
MYDLYVHHTPGREPEEQEQGQGQEQPPPPPPPPAPVCTGARNDSSKALSSSAVPLGSPRSSTSLPAHCKLSARALLPALSRPRILPHALILSVCQRLGREGERTRARARKRETESQREREKEREERERERERESERASERAKKSERERASERGGR